MKISVVITVYNVENYLDQTIRSVLEQTYQNTEIILVNDGSSDNSLEICRRYAAKYSHVVLIDQENGGAAFAANVGIARATGDYFILLDSDDYWEKDLLQSLIDEVMENGKADYLFFRHYEYYQRSNRKKEIFFNFDKEQLQSLSGPDLLQYILTREKNFPWYGWTALVRTAFVRENGLRFDEERSYSDVLWTPMMFLRAKNVRYIDKALYVYRLDREGQITSVPTYKILSDSIYISDYWAKNIVRHTDDPEVQKALLQNTVMRYYYAVWFCGSLTRDEKKRICNELNNHRYLLAYSHTKIQKMTNDLIRLTGFSVTATLFKAAIQVKKSLKKNRSKGLIFKKNMFGEKKRLNM